MSLRDATQVYITTPRGLRIACRLLGTQHDGPTAILTSGIGCGPVFMDAIAHELARDHRVVYWDYRAHGASDTSPDHRYAISDHAADLDAVVQAFSGNHRPVLVSFSMGVQVAVEWTRARPRDAAAYVFMLGVPRNPMHRTHVLRRNAARLASRIARHGQPVLSLVQPFSKAALRTQMVWRMARSVGVIDPHCPRDEFLEFVRYATDVPLDAYLGCCAGLLEHDATEVFERIRQPVLMLAAEGDVFISAEECQSFSERLSQARFELLRYASHAGSIEYGVYVAGRIRRFLERIRQEVAAAAAA